jgi:hypothetical protein
MMITSSIYSDGEKPLYKMFTAMIPAKNEHNFQPTVTIQLIWYVTPLTYSMEQSPS